MRERPQSPPEGMPCGPRYDAATEVTVRPENVTPVTGAAGDPLRLKRHVTRGTSKVHEGGGGVPTEALWLK